MAQPDVMSLPDAVASQPDAAFQREVAWPPEDNWLGTGTGLDAGLCLIAAGLLAPLIIFLVMLY
jgi:hypothetical protein